jgi:hypothetical protein
VEWGDAADLARAVQLDAHYVDLSLGLVDALVMAVAERLGALAIATLDLRDFGAVTLTGAARDLAAGPEERSAPYESAIGSPVGGAFSARSSADFSLIFLAGTPT